MSGCGLACRAACRVVSGGLSGCRVVSGAVGWTCRVVRSICPVVGSICRVVRLSGKLSGGLSDCQVGVVELSCNHSYCKHCLFPPVNVLSNTRCISSCQILL